jgi:4-amino-4-deoxy-L-arabinose transferase-like glycosyltransferase
VPRYLGSYLGLGALMLATFGTWDLYRRGARDRLTLATAGWALSCLVFLVIGILTPVDMRYYLASIPAIAIAGAAGASALWRQRPARAAAIALLIVICWGGVVTWYTTF